MNNSRIESRANREEHCNIERMLYNIFNHVYTIIKCSSILSNATNSFAFILLTEYEYYNRIYRHII